MTKEIIIIALICLILYYYYQQKYQPSIQDNSETENLLKDLKRQVQHYQKLYEKRVAHDLNKKTMETQTDNLGENKETQTPLKINYSRETQTNLSDKQISLLTQQWNQVASWAQEQGIDTNSKWNLGILKSKISQNLENKLNEKDQENKNLLNKLDKYLAEIEK